MVKHLETVDLPDPTPFAGIKFELRQTTFYRSSLNIEMLVDAAREELSSKEPEAFKVFLLAVMVGLRRREFGSQINLKHGLYSASRALRHGNIEITAQVYIDKRERAAIGLGHLLKAKEQSIIPMEPRAADSITPSQAKPS